MKLPKLPLFLKNLINPWSRVPPSIAFAGIPRLAGKLTEASKVKEINDRYPPIVHDHIVSPFKREFEVSAGERIADKWKVKPYDMTFHSKSDQPKSLDPNGPEALEKQTGGLYGLNYHYMLDTGSFLPPNSFPLPDFDFATPAGSTVMKWLYDRQREPCSFQRTALPSGLKYPAINRQESWVAPSAICVGNVDIGMTTSIYEGCVLKGDRNIIFIGHQSHLMEGCILTTAPPSQEYEPHVGGVIIGDLVVVGPNCRLHGCEIGHKVSIGSGSVIRYGAKIGTESILAAGSVVEEDQYIPPNEVWGGAPARFIRAVGDGDKYQNIAEAEDMYSTFKNYDDDQVVRSNVWTEYEAIQNNVEAALRERINGKIDQKMPPSLMMALLSNIPHDEHPNPPKSVAETIRGRFTNDFEHNRFAEQRAVWTGSYNQPAMPEGMY